MLQNKNSDVLYGSYDSLCNFSSVFLWVFTRIQANYIIFFFFFDQMPVVFSGQGGYGKRLSKLSEKPTNLLLPNF